MGFFDTLRHVLGGGDSRDATAESSNLTESDPGDDAVDSGPAQPPEPITVYDRAHWHKKLKRVLEELPESRGEWDDLMREARALELGPEWIASCQREEFLLLIRRAVSDRVVTAKEHRKLDLARDLIGISDDEAEAALHAIIAEAESFFGKPVKDG